MQFGEKDFSYYWKIIKVPLIILVSWNILAIIVAKISLYWYQSIFSGTASILFQVAIFGFIGYTTITEIKGTPKNSMWAGALTGILGGLIGAVLAIIMINFVPEVFEPSIRQAVAKGAPEETVRFMIRVGTYFSFITGPLFSGITGALVSGIAGLITKKVKG